MTDLSDPHKNLKLAASLKSPVAAFKKSVSEKEEAVAKI